MRDADRERNHQNQHGAPQGHRNTEQGQSPRPAPLDSLYAQGRMVKQDAAALVTSMQESAQLFNCYVAEQVELRPHTTLGVAAGLGYLLGGGLANRVTGAALGTAYKLALALAARELSARLAIPGMAAEPNPNRRLP